MAVTLIIALFAALALYAATLALTMASQTAPVGRSRAVSIPIGLAHGRGVLSRVRMALRAVSLYSVTRASYPATRVLQAGHQFHMRWVHTQADAAQMVNLQAFFYRPIRDLVRKAVRFHDFALATANSESPVSPSAPRHEATRPSPAVAGLFHFGPKPLGFIGEFVPGNSHLIFSGVSPKYTPKGAR